VPKVTANKMIETRGGTWLLPFWHERALLGRSRACAALKGAPAAGVLRSTDQCEPLPLLRSNLRGFGNP
jgi:hypothetical protein